MVAVKSCVKPATRKALKVCIFAMVGSENRVEYLLKNCELRVVLTL